MLEFVTLLRRDREVIDKGAVACLTDTYLRGSLFRAAETIVETQEEGRRITVLRVDEPTHGRVGDGQAWAAIDGLAVGTGRGADVQALLSTAVTNGASAATIERIAARLRGVFVIVASLPDGGMVVVTDPFGSYPVFTYSDRDLHAITNNPLLLETAFASLGRPLVRSATGLGTEAVFGSGALGSTGFEDVRLIPGGHSIRVEASGGVVVHPLASPRDRYRLEGDTETLVDRAAEEICENVRSIAEGDYEVRVCDLTGGVDSRIVLAALIAEGLEGSFGFFCSGRHPGPDYSASAYLQDIYELTEARGWLPPAALRFEEDPVASMQHLLYRTMGCYSHNFLTGVGTPREPDLLRLHGGFGETFRTFYSTRFPGGGARDAAAHLLRQRRWDWRRKLLTSDFARGLEDAVVDSIEARCHAGVAPAEALEHWYLEHRNRYHIGLTWRARLLQHASFHPLYSPAAVAAASTIPRERRAMNEVGFELMRRLHEPLALLPFAEYGWPRELTANTPDAQLYRGVRPFTPQSPVVELRPGRRRVGSPRRDTRETADLTPRRAGESAWAREQLALGRNHWWVPFDQVLPATRRYLRDLGTSSSVWDVFDRRRALALLDRPLDAGWNGREIQAVYKLLAAGIWISGDEAPNAAGEPLDSSLI